VLLEFALTQLPIPKPPPKNPARPWVHCVSPVGQVQVPLTQASPPGQTVPQEPQFRLSVCRSEQVVVLPKNVMLVQAVLPPVQPPHIPLLHCCPPGQRLPHEPQLLLSVCVLVHALLHIVSPVEQVHIPPVHVAPDPQA
jgi:hypothetical protein